MQSVATAVVRTTYGFDAFVPGFIDNIGAKAFKLKIVGEML
jgi:hypothetical protein